MDSELRVTPNQELSDRFPVAVVLDSIRSAWNVGAIFRTADAICAEHVYLGGICACPPHPGVIKTALGATETVPWSYHEKTVQAVNDLRERNYHILCLERTPRSEIFWETSLRKPVAIVLGHEILGIQPDILECADSIVEIPMYGSKHSLNVSTAFGILAYELHRRW